MGVPDVSVVIAAWNAQASVLTAVRSALDQTGVDVEVIVVDDASHDATRERVRSLEDPRLRLIAGDRNRGPGGARNLGFAAACGEWVAVLDSDDTMLAGRLARLVDTGRRFGADLVADDLLVFDPAVEAPERLSGFDFDRPFLVTLEGYALGKRGLGRRGDLGYLKPLFRRAFVTAHGLRYDERLRIGEDYMLVAEALVRRAVYVVDGFAGYRYAVGEDSISHRLSPERAEAMADANRRFLVEHASRLSEAERRALASRLENQRNLHAFVEMVAAVKSRNLAAFARRAATRPSALLHFQTPLRDRLGRLLRPAEVGAAAAPAGRRN